MNRKRSSPKRSMGVSPMHLELHGRDGHATRLLTGPLLLVVSMLAVACKPSHDMANQPHLKPDEPSNFFADGASQRPLVPGTVPRPPDASPGIPYVAAMSSGPSGLPAAPEAQSIPFPITRVVLERGQQRYDIFCSVCHGRLGDGDGMIVRRGFTPPPSYHIPRLRAAPDSHFYEVISNGYGAMFSYSDRVSADDRWMITAYIRALQLSTEHAQQTSALTPHEQRKLQGTRQ